MHTVTEEDLNSGELATMRTVSQSSIRRCGARFGNSVERSYPCKNKNSQETEKNLRKFLEPKQKPKVFFSNTLLS